ncbi:hypothetical protein [Limnovirga soli]|uniref:Uncharacterized protein n=1 Tax=Limnovirga soli TaxID=2656915 RepID=A0A8J8JPR3_9BACT|nr:hypothetical protein [Limnovirga soli]NNV53882.1 hypothetical protein [Limnovirga soli]
MPKAVKSYVNKKGLAYYRKTGRYNETTAEAVNVFKNGARSALSQKNLAPAGNQSAAAKTLKKVLEELAWE